MASFDPPRRQSRDALPPINNFDIDKYHLGKADHARYSLPNLNAISKGTLSSPQSTYSGPPPPYSSTGSLAHSGQSMSTYASPPEPGSKHSNRDEKEPLQGTNMLPSILDALKSTDMAPPSHGLAPNQSSGSVVGQTFGEAPKGPGNPFSQSSVPASALRSSISSMPDPSSIGTVPPPPTPPDVRRTPLISALGSPRSTSHQRLARPTAAPPDSSFRSPYITDSTRPGYPFPDHHPPQKSLAQSSSGFSFDQLARTDDVRPPFVKPEPRPYNETVKRHLEIYDAELALGEIVEATGHTRDIAKVWNQRYHQANRTTYGIDALPNTTEVDEMMRYSHHILDNLTRLREVAITQQNAINEQRARAAQGQHSDEDYHDVSEDYKHGGFASGDAKKRRGKAAPPGRCHSCNRAETPEWRRGPDGARTLCNACGLHYAKLTRKMGINKAATATGSNLRPKTLTDTQA